MLRPFVIAALPLTALFALVLGAFHLQPHDDPAQIYFGGCAMPCWQGVEPGVTAVKDGQALLEAATGVQAFEAPCFNAPANACDRFTWMSSENAANYTAIEVERNQIGTLFAYSPDFTVGEALLMLDALRVHQDGAYQGFAANGKFYVQLLYADSRLIVRAVAPCPGTYLDLMEAPVTTIEVDSANLNTHYVPATTFTAVRQMFEELCGLQ